MEQFCDKKRGFSSVAKGSYYFVKFFGFLILVQRDGDWTGIAKGGDDPQFGVVSLPYFLTTSPYLKLVPDKILLFQKNPSTALSFQDTATFQFFPSSLSPQ